MSKRVYTSFNPFFLIPFIAWLIIGGIVLLSFGKEELFTAINTRHTPFLDVSLFYITKTAEGVFNVILLLLLLGISALRNWWYVTAALLCNILPPLFVQYVKHSVNAPRPLKFFNEATWIHTLPEWPRFMERSFPSGHTCAAFSMYCFLAFLLPPRYRKWGIALFILALLVGYSRVYLAAHFFLDIYVGSIVGTVFTMIVVYFMKKYEHFFFTGKMKK